MNSDEYIELVKEETRKEKGLTCCKPVSDKIAEKLKEDGFENAKSIDAKAIGKSEKMGTDHTIIENDGVLYDYTWRQLEGSTDPEDVSVKKYYKIKDNIYSDNKNIKIQSEIEAYTFPDTKDYKGEIIIILK